jgi:N-formylmaleamate deformylase
MNSGETFQYGAHVRANGIRQHYLRFGGRGAALVVIPGIITPAILWSDVADRLGRVFDTYVLDIRGRGLSESGDHLDYGIDACADDVSAFIQALGLGRAILVGHSNGARIAIRAARRAEAAFERIVLLDPPVSGPGRRPYPSALEPMLKLLEAARRGEGWEGLLASPYPRWPEPLMRLRAQWMHTCDPRAATVTHRGFHEDDIHADLPLLKTPATLIAAGKGGVISEADEEEIRRLNPAIATSRVKNAGHQMQVDDFEGTFAALGRALGTKL